jgi:hypothetical protein
MPAITVNNVKYTLESSVISGANAKYKWSNSEASPTEYYTKHPVPHLSTDVVPDYAYPTSAAVDADKVAITAVNGVKLLPQVAFENGSRIAWNRITDKLFYNNGASIYRIAASDGDANVIEIVKVNGTALTPDSNKSVDITVFSGSGNSHAPGLVPDPGATSGSSKYLCEDGTWSTPADSDTTYTFVEGSTDGAFNVTPSGGSASSVTVHNVLKTTGGTMTGQVYHTINSPTISSNTVTITCDKKYNWVT